MNNHEEARYVNINENMIEEYLAELSSFHLSEEGKAVLRGYFRYLMQRKVKKIPYNFLIQADSDDLREQFTRSLIDIAGRIRHQILQIDGMSESELLEKPQKERYAACDVLMICHCLADDRYYSCDRDNSGTKAEKDDYDNRWNYIMDYYDARPERQLILCAHSDAAQGRIRENTRMFDRFFKHHIVLGNMSEEEIYNHVLNRVEEEVGKVTADFRYQLKTYIRTEYPRSEYKNRSFADNLYERMITLMFRRSTHCDYLSGICIPAYHRNETLENIDSDFNQLVGLDNVKETFRDIATLLGSLSGKEQKPYLHMVFNGNPGTGKTTVARHVARLFHALGIIRRNHVTEIMTADLLGEYVGQTAPKVERVLKRARGGVLFIDEAYLLNPKDEQGGRHSYRDECVGTLLKAMERHMDPLIIFAGYPKEMEAFLKTNPGLTSRIGYQIEFPDYSTEQLVDIFVRMCEQAGYSYDNQTLKAVERKIIALKFEDNFGNARTVENVFHQAVISCLRDDPENRVIQACHIGIGKEEHSIEMLEMQLNKMIGIENAKQVIVEQVMSNRFSKEQGKIPPSSNNMIFAGNAGTGKTTTAKLFAEMLFSIGVTKSPRTKMISARDLYVADVAEKLNQLCRDAMGGVLFIDEIYLLQSNPYKCAEVLSVLLELLETRKEDLIMILAGYEAEMEAFLSENQGLKSRFPITVLFDDFTADELCLMFRQNCEDANMFVSDEGMNRFRTVIEAEMQEDGFGNGRTVRNIYEQAFRRHAVRFYEGEACDPDVIVADDIFTPVAVNENSTRIGFA